MKLSGLQIKNYRSIVDSGEIRIEPFQVFVGENNAGKSNILRAIDVFLAVGTSGVQESSFFNKTQPIIITATFSDLTSEERKSLQPYLIDDKLTLEKHLSLQTDERTRRTKIETKYRGHVAKPKAWWLSVDEITKQKGDRPNWRQIAEENGILDYVLQQGNKVTKASYEAGIRRLLQERTDIEYERPVLSETQEIQQALPKELPSFYLLPAITDYSSEIDRRSSSTVFRRLMGDLADRIVKTDPRYSEIELSLQKVKQLLNPPVKGEQRPDELRRLDILSEIEYKLCSEVAKLMPSVESIRLEVFLEETRDLFSRGVSLRVDDGVLTDVVDKGHGMQRSVVFGLLQMLIMNQRDQLLTAMGDESRPARPIILAIEEPELYMHPQMQRLIFKALRQFSETDQVIYCTHSPAFVDVSAYHSIGVVRKDSISVGTRVHQCAEGALGSPDERKGFQFLNSFDVGHNQMFFAKKTVLVEGEQDMIALLAAGRKMKLFAEFPEEIGYTIVVTGNKEEIPKFQKILNAFRLPYVVWLELDGKGEDEGKNREIIDFLNGNRCVKLPKRLEDVVGYNGHFGKTYDAKKYFKDSNNITDQLCQLAGQVFNQDV